ncbi:MULTISPECIES: hypothetical protein [Microbacterium]|uniref:hypothetical protein n=1 Tax=Microbacterium TaxID=33882 RepID=UPI00277D775F|nr:MULTISPECIES: hypothetical protein [Microbacterium]MDQ1085396.1 hypothetical protein [Microbacterium sp. SORGH_AS_0344]MDQ1169298.1 hypothetical protein [Microbacterium proteolyticum]
MSDNSGLTNALAALPIYRGLCWRGFPREITAPIPLDSVLPATRDVRLATGNFEGVGAIAIVSSTARDVALLSASPQDGEVAFLPGTTLIPLGPRRDLSGLSLQILGESVPASEQFIPTDDVLQETIQQARARGPAALERAARFGWRPPIDDGGSQTGGRSG